MQLWYLFLSFPWLWTPSQCCWRGLCYLSLYSLAFAYHSWNIETEDKTPVFIGTTDPFAESINIYDQSIANTVTNYVSETIKFCALKRWGCLPNRRLLLNLDTEMCTHTSWILTQKGPSSKKLPQVWEFALTTGTMFF